MTESFEDNNSIAVRLEDAWKRLYIQDNLGRGEILDKNPRRELVEWLRFCVGLDSEILKLNYDETIDMNIHQALDGLYKERLFAEQEKR